MQVIWMGSERRNAVRTMSIGVRNRSSKVTSGRAADAASTSRRVRPRCHGSENGSHEASHPTVNPRSISTDGNWVKYRSTNPPSAEGLTLQSQYDCRSTSRGVDDAERRRSVNHDRRYSAVIAARLKMPFTTAYTSDNSARPFL